MRLASKMYTKDYANEKIFLSKRFQYPRDPILRLNVVQFEAKNNLEKDLMTGRLSFHKVSCRCGESDDIVLATTDRYGFWVRTVICNHCGLLRTDPQFTPSSLEIFYKEYYRSLYTGNNLPNKSFFLNQIKIGEKIRKILTKHTDFISGTVFDLGTGADGILVPFKRVGCKIIGVDYDQEYLAMGRKEELNLLEGGIEVSKELDVKADLIILSHVLEHIPDIDSMISQLNEVLNPRGLRYIEAPGLFGISDGAYNDFLLYLQNAHLYHFIFDSLSQILLNHGFELVFGNEKIETVFRKSFTTKKVKSNSQLAEQSIRFI